MTTKIALFTTTLFVVFLIFVFAAFLIPDVLRQSLAWLFRLAVGGLGVLLVIILAYTSIDGIERIKTRRAERQAIEHRADVMTITAPANHQVFIHERGGSYRNLHLDARWAINEQPPTQEEVQAWSVYHSVHATRHNQVSANEVKLIEANQPVDLLSFLRPVRRGLIVGASDAGKTTLFKWFVEQRTQASQVVVIDPHSGPDKWPCEIIGLGGDHKAVSKTLDQFLALMKKRYREIGAGLVEEEGHDKITLLVDEWMGIAEECDNAAYVFRRLLTEARKANIDLWLGSHSERVEPLALKGRGDLKDGLVIVKLNYNQITQERSAVVKIKYDDHTDEYPAILPGTFDGHTWSVNQPDRLELPEPEMSEEEARIMAEYQPTRSMRENTQAIWGPGKFGTHYKNRIEETLRKFG